MKILLVSPLPPPAGGIATWTLMYREYCQEHDISLHIVNTALQGTRAAKKGSQLRILDELKRTIFVLCDFGKAIKQRPDVTHINTSCSKLGILRDYLCVLRAKRQHIPVVLQCHCNIEDQLKGKLAHKVFQKAANAAAGVWVLNCASAEFTEKQTKTPISIIPNFISESRIVPQKKIRETVQEVIFVGHVRKEKGVREIYDAARKFPQITFTLVGPVQDEIATMKAPDNVVLVGSRPPEDVPQYLQKADVFLFPSYTEGFANALLEAMATGLPIVATDVGANKEMLEDCGGAIVPAGNSKLLCEALKELDSMPEIRQQISAWNLNKVKTNYTTNVVLGKIIRQYEKIMKS